MPEIEIVERTVIVVDEVKGVVGGQYPKWVFTDKEGKEYKVRPDRQQYFEAVVPGRAVEIGWATFNRIKYPYNATAIKDKIEVVEPTHLEPSGALVVQRDAEATRLRSMAISYAKDLAMAKVIELKEIRAYADKFLAYMLNEESALVKEAKKLNRDVEEEEETGERMPY